jgi:hypothetical protein
MLQETFNRVCSYSCLLPASIAFVASDLSYSRAKYSKAINSAVPELKYCLTRHETGLKIQVSVIRYDLAFG